MINLAAPGTPGSKGSPMTVEQLEDFISKANGGAEVKVKGFTELSPSDVATMDSQKLRELTSNGNKLSNGLRINHNLKEQLSQSLYDVSRKPKKIFEDRERNLFMILDEDDCLWLLEKNRWVELKEPSFPDLPRKEIK